MTDAVVPTLSEDGWVKTPLMMADYLFSHFLLADYSQTEVYEGQVSSMSWILHESNNNVSTTIRLMENGLKTYFGRYFPRVDVQVTDSTADVNSSKVALSIYVAFTDKEGNDHTLDKAIELTDSNTARVINLNNYGG